MGTREDFRALAVDAPVVALESGVALSKGGDNVLKVSVDREEKPHESPSLTIGTAGVLLTFTRAIGHLGGQPP